MNSWRRSETPLLAELLLTVLVVMMWMIGDADSTKVVEGVAGRAVSLPCQLSPPDPQDKAVLALWYKQGHRLPVYSYDARGDGASGTHQPNEALLATRGEFVVRESPAKLILSPALASDQGIYTCRVDYVTSATHNTVVNLTIIEPPEKLSIFTREGMEVRGDKVGPISEGSPLHIYCLVKGGVPQPSITWWSEGELLESKTEVMRSGDVRSDFKKAEITRSFQSRSFTCRALNNNQTIPLVRTVSLEMNLRPLSANVRVPTDPLIADKSYTFSCESHGSKPTATMSWVLGSQELDSVRSRGKSKEGVTTGTVSFLVQDTDNGKVLKCQAMNPNIPGSTILDAVKLNVHYPPNVSLELGRSLDPDKIKQGDDVYFQCKVDANPKPYKISWFRNDDEILPNATTGVLVTSDSLVLQSVSREGAGEYTCAATNTQGTHKSNAVSLNIMYPPECLMDDQLTTRAISKGERVNISCRVSSNPLRASFHWKLNSSDRTYHSTGIPDNSRDQLVSHYAFQGTSDKDFGRLLCWANNSVGVQKRACVFNIIPAGEPSKVDNCEVLNNTAENIEVACDAGFDGGLEQHFIAEVFDESGKLHLNLSSSEPSFSIHSLEPGKTYTIRISSYNKKGRSSAVTVTAPTLKVAEKRMGETKAFIYSPLIVIFIAILGVFSVFIVLLVIVTRWRKNMSSTSSAPITRMPSPTPANKSAQPSHNPNQNTTTTANLSLKPSITLDEISPSKDSMMKKSPSAGEDESKPKKRVMLLENGRLERTGVSPTPKSQNHADSQLRSNRYDQPLTNQKNSSPLTDYYANQNKSSYPPSYSPDLISLSPGSSVTSSPIPAFPISGPPPPPHRNFPRIALPPMNALSPLPEEYSHHQHSHHLSTLPRNHREFDDRNHLLDDDMEENRLMGGGGFRASVGERYHLMQEIKANPKYVVRRSGLDLNDESFV